MEIRKDFWKDRNVLITGHTGFKGSWLSLWLQAYGANLSGIALAPDDGLSLFRIAGVAERMKHNVIDIRNYNELQNSINDIKPEIIFHMEAQPFVRKSYLEPIETYETNVIGTVNLLEASRKCNSVKAVVNITTDKCYENFEITRGYKEDDRMGGYDPYSSSKACAELVSAAYRNSFLKNECISMATVRAGNVIGGGDWSDDRLVPNILNSLESNKDIYVRNPDAVRPWQHVLEPLSGYLFLAEKLYTDNNTIYADGWNFGPNDEDAKSVRWIVNNMLSIWGSNKKLCKQPGNHPHEANYLKLDISKAKKHLNWYPRLSLNEALNYIVDWHKSFLAGEDIKSKTLEQIEKYSTLISKN